MKFWQRFLTSVRARWNNNARQRVLMALYYSDDVEHGAMELSEKSHILTYGNLYTILMSLESEGILQSRFVDGPYPRRRVYSFTENGKTLAAVELLIS